MAEATLAITFADLKTEVGYFLGYTATEANWTATQIAEIARIIKSGLRRFYYPDPVEGRVPHQWSFLKPTMTVATVASTATATMSDSFGGIEGDLTFAAADSSFWTVKLMPEAVVREYRQNNNAASGKPIMAALQTIVPSQVASDGGTRWQLLFYPTPDAIYTLSFKQTMLADILVATTTEYPYGGALHGETIQEFCLAVAEERSGDAFGIHANLAQRRMLASIEADINGFRPEFFGYNADRSDIQARPSRVDYANISIQGVPL
jgi:hypothetical protein